MVSTVTAVSFVWAPALGQETGGPLFTAGVSSTLRLNDNLDLNTPSNGTSLVSETRLSFGFESVTRTQEFRISFSDVLEFGFGDDAPDSPTFTDTRFDLDYSWRGKNSALDFNASLRIDDIDDDDNDLLAIGGGSQTDTSVGLRFETGINDPFGVEVAVSHARVDFTDTTDPDLIDERTTNATISGIFRPNQTTETRLTYSHTLFEEDDPQNTERTTKALSFSGAVTLDPVTRVTGSIGWTQIVTEDDDDTETDDGFTASLGYARDLPAGAIAISLDYTLTRLGHRTDVLLTRDFELPTGGFGFEVGVTSIDGDDLGFIGGVNYLRQWPDQAFRASLSTEILIDDTTNTTRRRTQASVEYERDINELESLEFGVSYGALTDGGSGSITDRSRITASATYSRDLTRDWVMETGYIHRFRTEEGEPDASSNEIFVRLGRDFSWRP